MSQLVKRVSQAAGVTARPHMFRHTWVDVNLDGDMREHDLMKLAGWSPTDMLKVYGATRAEQRALDAGRAIQVGQIMKKRAVAP